MKLIVVIFCLVAGAITGGFGGAIGGLILGVVVALIMGAKTEEEAPAKASAPTPTAAGNDRLVARIAQLERQVERLEAALEKIQPGALDKTAAEPPPPATVSPAPAPAQAASTPRAPSYVIRVGSEESMVPPNAPPAAPLPQAVKPLAPIPLAETHAATPAPVESVPVRVDSTAADTAPTLPAMGDPESAPDTAPDTAFADTEAPEEDAAAGDAPATAATTSERTLEDPWSMLTQSSPPGPVRPLRQPAPVEAPSQAAAFIRRLIFGGNTIVKVGVLILFLGLAFLLRYVAGQVTVPMEARYAGVALIGVILLGLGWRLRDRKDAGGGSDYGVVLQGGGVGVLYLTTLAAMKLHPLIPTSLGFGLMVAVAGLCALLAVAQNAPWMAYVATAAGFATPLLVSTGESRPMALFSYLAILDMAIVLMAWFKAWRPLNLVGFIGTFSLASGWAQRYYTPADEPVCQSFLLLFFLMFTVISVLFARRALAHGDAPDASKPFGAQALDALRAVGRVDSSLVFGVPLTAYGLQYSMVQADRWLPALSAAVLAAFYLLLGRALWGREGAARRYSLLAEAYGVVGVLFATLAIPLALDSTWTSATWAVEAASMYWLGTRQHRAYSRAFGLVMLGVAAVRTFIALQISVAPRAPVLHGSLMGMLLLAGSAFAVFWVHRRALMAASQTSPTDNWDSVGADASLWLGVGAVSVIPWMLVEPLWASVATSALALAAQRVQMRLQTVPLPWCSRVMQLVALGGFASTLHIKADAAMLENGWQGLLAAVLIAGTLLAQVIPALRASWRRSMDATHANEAVEWNLGVSVGLIVGVGLLSASLLFAMPLESATLVWPVLALPALWFGLRMAFPALCWVWLGLTLASATALLTLGPRVFQIDGLVAASQWQPLGGLGWWNALLIMVCALVSGLMLQADLLRERRGEGRHLGWVKLPVAQLVSVLWILAWWTATSVPEIFRHAHLGDGASVSSLPALLVLWSSFTAVAMHWLAARRDWAAMGRVSILHWPLLLLLVATACMINRGGPISDNLGWLAWPIALVAQVWLLRRAEAWWGPPVMRALHLLGYWLFSGLAVSEVWWFVGQATSGESAWRDLGWLLPPLLLVGVASREWGLTRWPLKDYHGVYRRIGPVPYAAMLALWLVWSLVQAGDAAPLPYIPLLNPLEIGQGLTALVLLAWVRNWNAGQTSPPASALDLQRLRPWAAGTAFVMITTMILRACHQWAGVDWAVDALWASRLTQATVSIVWALMGVGLMLLGHRRVQRMVWVAGASLLGIVVGKLFLVELADKGGLWRIVSFIVVGLLLLLVGYFAPVPPARPEPGNSDGGDRKDGPQPPGGGST